MKNLLELIMVSSLILVAYGIALTDLETFPLTIVGFILGIAWALLHSSKETLFFLLPPAIVVAFAFILPEPWPADQLALRRLALSLGLWTLALGTTWRIQQYYIAKRRRG
ncbi:MAG: hypothetical protein WEC84_01215 [Candidatus Andersenbacteria bacterium]